MYAKQRPPREGQAANFLSRKASLLAMLPAGKVIQGRLMWKKGFNRRLVLAGGGAGALTAGRVWPRPPNGGFNPSHADPRAFRRGNAAEPATLDPNKSQLQWEDWIMGDMF